MTQSQGRRPNDLVIPPRAEQIGDVPETEVARRAYELYEQRGRDEGHEVDDWLQAESEVTQHKAKAVGA